MKMHTQNKVIGENVVDIELLRIEKLIEEREAYEKEFFSMAYPAEDINYLIEEYVPQMETLEVPCILNDSKVDIFNPFVDEFCHEWLRNEILIKEREEYESMYIDSIFDDFAVNDIFDCQISAMEEEDFIERDGYEYDYNFEEENYEDYIYDEYEEDMFWNLHYLRQSQFEKPKCGCAYMDYMPHDDGLCDYMDCYDYPDGPDENLNGIKFY